VALSLRVSDDQVGVPAEVLGVLLSCRAWRTSDLRDGNRIPAAVATVHEAHDAALFGEVIVVLWLASSGEAAGGAG